MDSFDDNVKNAYYCKIVDFVNTLNNTNTNIIIAQSNLFILFHLISYVVSTNNTPPLILFGSNLPGTHKPTLKSL